MHVTMADVRGLMTIVVVLVIGAVQATNHPRTVGQGKQSGANAIKVVSNDKGPRCHHPLINNCDTSVYPILDWELSGWFYHAMFKSCRPMYSPKGVHICTENQDLPKTREMCEDLCGESCLMSNGSTGICTFHQICKIVNDKATAHPRPCGSYNVNCCPKVTDDNLVPFVDPSQNSNGNGELDNRISTDQSSSRNGTLYIYRLPNNRLAEAKHN
ncbi:uncharacterized protein LOC113556186 [Rhopalosiphum maidis]|uniref:uncharacterized protein LOC113556186 n=1 Tax=Rhopalosiphum maidis TaxID=43146 RepID=UPI000F003819|nr:uncharacterized protein LOC113556186 [Rhopalosiphum maidis]